MDAARLVNVDLSGFSEDDLDATLFVLRIALRKGNTLDDELKFEAYAAFGRITLEIEERGL